MIFDHYEKRKRHEKKCEKPSLKPPRMSFPLVRGRFCCPKCDRGYSHKKNALRHANTCYGIPRKSRAISCNTCEKVFSSSWKLKRHIITHSRIFYTCESCGVKYKFKKSYERHQQNCGNANGGSEAEKYGEYEADDPMG